MGAEFSRSNRARQATFEMPAAPTCPRGFGKSHRWMSIVLSLTVAANLAATDPRTGAGADHLLAAAAAARS